MALALGGGRWAVARTKSREGSAAQAGGIVCDLSGEAGRAMRKPPGGWSKGGRVMW